MKKIATFVVVVLAVVALTSSCKTHEKCPAYQGSQIFVQPAGETASTVIASDLKGI